MYKPRDSGFSLIEVLLSVVIAGILAGTVAFSFSAFSRSTAAGTCTSEHKTLATAYSSFLAAYGPRSIPVGSQPAPPGASWVAGQDPELTLRAAGLLPAPSENFVLSTSGNISVSVNSPQQCTE